MELRHLRYFVAVAEELNFSRAARRLHVSQPPLSRQIRDLEDELGVSLFDRNNNKVRLTPAGQFLLDEARRLLEHTEAVVHKIRDLGQAHREELHIGYIANVQGPLVIEIATRFRAKHPQVAVKVFDFTIVEQVAALRAGRIDLAFVGLGQAAQQSGIHLESIGTTYAVLALPKNHPQAGRKHLPLAEFKNAPFITASENAFPGARQYVLDCCSQAGFRPRIVHETMQAMDVLNLVAIGEGVALVPEQMRRVRVAGVVFRELAPPAPRVESSMAWREGQDSQTLLEFVATAKCTYQELFAFKRLRKA